MKKQKMLITLAGLVVAVATTATVAAYTLAGDGSSPPANETVGTQEPGFQDDNPTFDGAADTIYDGKGSVSVINPDVKGDDPLAGKVLPDEGGIVPIGLAPTDTQVAPPLHGDPPPPVGRPLPEPLDGTDVPGTSPVSPPPTDDVDDPDDQVLRVDPATGLLIDPLLATGAEVKVTGEVVSEGIFSVDGSVLPEPLDGTDVPGTSPVSPPPTDDVDDPDDQVLRVDPATGLLIDPLLATGAEVKVTGEVVSVSSQWTAASLRSTGRGS